MVIGIAIILMSSRGFQDTQEQRLMNNKQGNTKLRPWMDELVVSTLF